MNNGKLERVREYSKHAVLIILLLLTILPIYILITMSLKANFQIKIDIFGLPNPVRLSNYNQAFDKLLGNLFNSVIISTVSTVSIMFLSAIVGFTFSRLEFPGKKVLYIAILILMMVPSVVTLAPLIKLIETLHLRDTWWALYLPYLAGGQVMGSVLTKNFLDGQPEELYKAAMIDGANTAKLFSKICLPLAKPILATIFVMNAVNIYNDYFTPFMFLESMDKMPITVALRLFNVKFVEGASGAESGMMYAGYVLSTIPLLLIFLFGSRVYIEGLTSGAVKM